jgi:hypothetical protein
MVQALLIKGNIMLPVINTLNDMGDGKASGLHGFFDSHDEFCQFP